MDAATEGPWKASQGVMVAYVYGVRLSSNIAKCYIGRTVDLGANAGMADAAFIAAARTAVPELLDEVDALQAALAERDADVGRLRALLDRALLAAVNAQIRVAEAEPALALEAAILDEENVVGWDPQVKALWRIQRALDACRAARSKGGSP